MYWVGERCIRGETVAQGGGLVGRRAERGFHHVLPDYGR